MFKKLDSLEENYESLSAKVMDPEIISDNNLYKKLMKEHSDLSPIIETYRNYKNTLEEIDDLKLMLEDSDHDIRQMAKDDLKVAQENLENLSSNLKILLLPKDPNDDKNVVVEIRGGAGGDESALFAGSLFRMYSRFAERNRWKIEIMSMNESDVGGYKEIVFLINGRGAYSRLKFESGVHRVQRIPATESGGRIHTSTTTVAVLPEAEEVDVELDMNDVRIDVFRSSGNGGQSVNTTDSAVRVTHNPSGIVISCQDEKSQLKNKDKALKILRAKLYDLELEKQQDLMSSERKSQVGRGNRNERIRTYNFPQGRVTDHRIGLTLHQIDSIMDGDLVDLIDALTANHQAENLQSEID